MAAARTSYCLSATIRGNERRVLKQQSRGFLQLIFLLVFVFILIRFFPILIRLTQMAAMGVVEFWWAVLILSLGGWLVWVLRKRNSG